MVGLLHQRRAPAAHTRSHPLDSGRHVGRGAARRRAATRFSQALAIAVHSSVVLVIGQLVATPLHYVRESLTSPLNASRGAAAHGRRHGSGPVFRGDGLVRAVVGRAARRWVVGSHRPADTTVRRPHRLVFIGFAAVMATALAVMGGGPNRVSQEMGTGVIALVVIAGGAAAISRGGAARGTGDGRDAPEARPRGHRVGLRQDRSEEDRQYQRAVDGSRHPAGRQRRRPRQGRPVPAADRSGRPPKARCVATRRASPRPARRSNSRASG